MILRIDPLERTGRGGEFRMFSSVSCAAAAAGVLAVAVPLVKFAVDFVFRLVG